MTAPIPTSTPSPLAAAAASANAASRTQARITAVTSGKGGVGKTMVSANLAAALARRGERVLVIDADLGLANLDVVLNLQPRATLHDVFTGKVALEAALVEAPGGFHVLLAGSGLVEYSHLTPEVREQLVAVLAKVRPRYDRVLLDTGAGISDVVLFAVSLADEVLVIATPEPTAMADAYATIKVLAIQQGREAIQLVVNQTQRLGEGRNVAQQLQSVIDRFVQRPEGHAVRLNYVGEIPSDNSVRQSVQRRQLMVMNYPGCPAALAIAQLAGKLPALATR
ncbi:MinD/ParA family protein [Sphaerotilus mobilis]|uniref:Flagellar biosynthesis protein FlhG n=1 Tax=Sphaerotilus mobilis TaxID=47994 RepID=A0A4Q7LC93_9BURK|nr:MinD/ParA family protein [Sphaerotilus mobilis]RZS51995.1 flagellar biosynthesis protein FlhG [Sphaerotilus mobilis]